MALKTIGFDEDVIVGDEVRFILDTHDGSNCVSDPYLISEVKIFFINREFTDPTASEYAAEFFNPEIKDEYERAKRSVCIKSKQSVKAASTGSLSLSGLQTVDGIVLKEGDRVLIKDQASLSDNGVYVVSEGAWKRSEDASEGKVTSGMYLFVENGISNIGTGWVLEAENPVSVGTSELKFLLFASNWEPASPDEQAMENSRKLEEIRIQMEASKITSPFFYKDAVVVKKFGGDTDFSGELFPAWLNPDYVRPELKLKVASDNILGRAEDASGAVIGKFVLDWGTEGMREGDYFICWFWRPNMGDTTFSSHQFFRLTGNDKATSSIPTHRVRQDKYEILMDRYLPEMFKTRISDGDLAPEVLSEFNKAVAKGFMFIENQASAVIDLLDSNSINEQLMPLLSNMFNLKVKSNDPTLWRRQIKKAIPNFKKKGSLSGLREAMNDSGMKLIRLARMWQVVPKYTKQEHFTYSDSSAFELSKVPLTIADCNFRLWRRNSEDLSWTELGSACGSSSSSSGHWSSSFINVSGNLMNWVGPVLKEGDSIRVLYTYRNIPAGEQAKEHYLRSLPLMDDRDERDQEYPPKNWNVHLIEEDDENFEVLVPVRHPLSDPIVWGRVRTEFPYSENLYNMEEYNGSKRDSYDPCDIGKSFMDACGQCASSKFNMDIEIESLSDETFKEARQIVEEYMPFHAVPNSFNLWGANNEFVRSSEEKIEAMVLFSGEEFTLSGEAQHIFNKDVYRSEWQMVRRDALANYEILSSPTSGINWNGTIKNTRIVLFPRVTIEDVTSSCWDEPFGSLGSCLGSSSSSKSSDRSKRNWTSQFDSFNINTEIIGTDPFENGNLLEVSTGAVYNYSIVSLDGSSAVVQGNVDSSLVGPVFQYQISNRIADLTVKITQHEEIIFWDEDVDFTITGLVTQYDIDKGLASGSAWKILFEDKQYSIINILPDGTLLLEELGSISPISGWKLMNGSTSEKEGFAGTKSVTGYGLVEVLSPSGLDTRSILKIGDIVYIGWNSSKRMYPIRSFQKDANKFYIKGYLEGETGSEDIKVYRRIIERKIGQFGYDGLTVVADDDLESALWPSSSSSTETDSSRIENYIMFVDDKYYTISEIDGNTAMISGLSGNYDTSGSPIQFNIYKFSKENLTLSEKQVPPYDTKPETHTFDYVDRSGGVILSSTQGMSSGFVSSLLNSSEPIDFMSQDERIEYKIEYREDKK